MARENNQPPTLNKSDSEVSQESTKRVCEIDTKRPVEATPESNASPASINSGDLGVLVEQVLVNDIKKKKVDSTASDKRRLDMEGSIQDEKEPKAAKVKGGKRATLVRLNPASRASGRPKQKAKLKKAKEIEETMLFVDNLVSYGDITLESFEEAVKTKELSVAGIGDTTRAIRPMFESAVFKRPKAFLIADKPTQVVETGVRFVLPEALVLKCLDSAKNVIIRQQLLSDKNPTAKELGVSILDVGTFSILDIERMKLWHEVSRKLLKAQKLIKFVKNLSIERGAESKKQQEILKTIPHMGADTVYHTGGHDIHFTELARFGDESWLSDTCVYLASQRVAEEATKLSWWQPKIESVVDPIYLQMADVERRSGFIDTSDRIFSQIQANRIVCCPIYINVTFPHWCGIIFDMERQTVWTYDPFYREDFLRRVEDIFESRFRPIMATAMEVKNFPGSLQDDGYSCGVLVVLWFEQYMSIARATPPDQSIPFPRGNKLHPKDLTYMRFKHLSYVFDRVVADADIDQ
ncbi:hypothetical protein GN958_ATG16879 [Phytophthora infestans]|uniref:Ubiquitin-like protease family profile domain-containing protein n=1 Tax=Phytophthora infestans TaxID=4787 RepID=A0A8S9U0U2_PHYIN|nr:hypothetical protein GN958_ATG16879 [Phytophthora infestans]